MMMVFRVLRDGLQTEAGRTNRAYIIKMLPPAAKIPQNKESRLKVLGFFLTSVKGCPRSFMMSRMIQPNKAPMEKAQKLNTLVEVPGHT